MTVSVHVCLVSQMFLSAEKALSSAPHRAAPFVAALQGLLCPPSELCEWTTSETSETAHAWTTGSADAVTLQTFSCSSPSSPIITIEALAEVHQSLMDMVVADAAGNNSAVCTVLLQNLPRWVQALPPQRPAERSEGEGADDSSSRSSASAWTQLRVLRPIVQKYLRSSQEAGAIRFLRVGKRD